MYYTQKNLTSSYLRNHAPKEKEHQEATEEIKDDVSRLVKFKVDGIVPVVEKGDIVPHFANKSRGKYINHKQLTKEEIIQLRREQNREAARRMRRKKAQQRAFLEEEINKIQQELKNNSDKTATMELKSKLEQLEASRQEIIAIQNRSSQNKKNKRKVW